MSWSVQFTSKESLTVEEVEEAVKANHGGELMSEVADQVEAAVDAANAIISSDSIGSVGKLYNINLNGHANENHEPKEGWSNDCVTVSVYQV